MATPDKKKYLPDLISPSAIIEVVKFNSRTGEFVGLKLMSHGDFKKMDRQKGFRYQEFQKGFSSYKNK
jgi:hypothetical protein